MRRRTDNYPVIFWRCEHTSPILVEEVEGVQKKVARCLRCGERGPAVRGEAEEALLALRGRAS